jgi:membrane associated rhomboid family serine protease
MINFLTSMVKTMPVTTFMMGLMLVTSSAAMVQPSLFLKLLLHPSSIWQEQQFFRLVTADWVHNGLMHLLINVFLLYAAGGTLESYLRKSGDAGSWQYGVIYGASMLSGAVTVTIINRKDFTYSTAGASGSLVGCMLSYMMLQPHESGFYLPVVGAVNNMYSALIVIVGLIVYQARSKNPMINHEIHFFGALGGVAATLLLFPEIIA